MDEVIRIAVVDFKVLSKYYLIYSHTLGDTGRTTASERVLVNRISFNLLLKSSIFDPEGRLFELKFDFSNQFKNIFRYFTSVITAFNSRFQAPSSLRCRWLWRTAPTWTIWWLSMPLNRCLPTSTWTAWSRCCRTSRRAGCSACCAVVRLRSIGSTRFRSVTSRPSSKFGRLLTFFLCNSGFPLEVPISELSALKHLKKNRRLLGLKIFFQIQFKIITVFDRSIFNLNWGAEIDKFKRVPPYMCVMYVVRNLFITCHSDCHHQMFSFARVRAKRNTLSASLVSFSLCERGILILRRDDW